MIALFSVRTKIICYLNIFKFCDNGSILTWISARTDRQKNIKLSDGNTNDSSIIIKKRPFEQKQIYGKWSTHWKMLPLKRLKKILMLPCKKSIWLMIIILGVRTFSLEAYHMIYSPKKCSDSRTNMKLSHNSNINNGTTKKKDTFPRTTAVTTKNEN